MTLRVPLYDRLPEIHRVRDAEQSPPDQLRSYLAAVESAFGAIHENIEQLHHDCFIETCDDWVVPYLADLLGTSHLKGDPWTVRADVADTIPLRRRKGTRLALERLALNLTQWAARAVELRDNLGWTQHLNHQRPDAGGRPPLSLPGRSRFTVPRGGTVPVRDPAQLSLLGTPFDPFSHTADVKRADSGARHINLPNVAVMLWRLDAYTLPLVRSLAHAVADLVAETPAGRPPPDPDARHALFAARFDLDPLDRPLRLFNRWDYRPGDDTLAPPDGVPGPILAARLTSGSEAGNPNAYLTVDPYAAPATAASTDLQADAAGLTVFVPDPPFADQPWTFRGDNLCAWQHGLRRPLANREIVIDPEIGRVLIGVASLAEAEALRQQTLFRPTYGSVGPIGAHPVSRPDIPPPWTEVTRLAATALPGGVSLAQALIDADLSTPGAPVVIEITDSLVHPLDPTDAAFGPLLHLADGQPAWQLARPLLIRAADGQRPIISLVRPLRFRPFDPAAPANAGLAVRLEGLFLTRVPTFPAADALIARAAVARLELIGCTLDPGGHRQRNGEREPLFGPALALDANHGFVAGSPGDLTFVPTPEILLQRTVTGPLRIDPEYRLTIADSILDAGAGVTADGTAAWALAAATGDPVTGWACPLDLRGVTVFGRVRCTRLHGQGGIFLHALEVHNNQTGCIKFSHFSTAANRLPPNHACLFADDAPLSFTSEWHGQPGYAQLRRSSDPRVLTRGPGDDAMGATGFLLEAHKWINLSVRLREAMPVGIRPLLIPVT